MMSPYSEAIFIFHMRHSIKRVMNASSPLSKEYHYCFQLTTWNMQKYSLSDWVSNVSITRPPYVKKSLNIPVCPAAINFEEKSPELGPISVDMDLQGQRIRLMHELDYSEKSSRTSSSYQLHVVRIHDGERDRFERIGAIVHTGSPADVRKVQKYINRRLKDLKDSDIAKLDPRSLLESADDASSTTHSAPTVPPITITMHPGQPLTSAPPSSASKSSLPKIVLKPQPGGYVVAQPKEEKLSVPISSPHLSPGPEASHSPKKSKHSEKKKKRRHESKETKSSSRHSIPPNPSTSLDPVAVPNTVPPIIRPPASDHERLLSQFDSLFPAEVKPTVDVPKKVLKRKSPEVVAAPKVILKLSPFLAASDSPALTRHSPASDPVLSNDSPVGIPPTKEREENTPLPFQNYASPATAIPISDERPFINTARETLASVPARIVSPLQDEEKSLVDVPEDSVIPSPVRSTNHSAMQSPFAEPLRHKMRPTPNCHETVVASPKPQSQDIVPEKPALPDAARESIKPPVPPNEGLNNVVSNINPTAVELSSQVPTYPVNPSEASVPDDQLLKYRGQEQDVHKDEIVRYDDGREVVVSYDLRLAVAQHLMQPEMSEAMQDAILTVFHFYGAYEEVRDNEAIVSLRYLPAVGVLDLLRLFHDRAR